MEMEMVKEIDVHNGMPIKKYQVVKPKHIGVGGEYICTHERFRKKLTVRCLKVYEHSFLGEIIDHNPVDDLEYRKKGGKTTISFRRVIQMLKIGDTKAKQPKRRLTEQEKEAKKREKPTVVHFADGRMKHYKSIKETAVDLGYSPTSFKFYLNRYTKSKKHGLIYVELEDSGRTKPLNFEFHKEHGKRYICMENGVEIARGTVRGIAEVLGVSTDVVYYYKGVGGKRRLAEWSGE